MNVHVPKDRITMSHQGYGFVEFASEEDADYAIKIMNMIKFYGKPIRVNKVLHHSILLLYGEVVPYSIGRPVRATITLYPIGRPIIATIILYPIGSVTDNYLHFC